MPLTTNGWLTLFEAAGATSEMTEAKYAEMKIGLIPKDDQASRADWGAFLAKGLELLWLSPKPDFLAVTRDIARGAGEI